MFAGAAREAVFSRPDIIQRINADFVPVALKAALVNNPPPGAEGHLLREIGRSKPAPQGICVANSSGKVLAWSLSFDDEKSVADFVDYALKRYSKHPYASKPCATERYMKYPSNKLRDVADDGRVLRIPEEHAHATDCPAGLRASKGTFLARVVGRTLDKDGRPTGDTIRQEHYIEDVFQIPPASQAALADAVAAAGEERVRVPAELARLIVTYAYLGQLDVRPLSSPLPQHKLEVDEVELWARKVGPGRLRIEGRSHVAGGDGRTRGDGARYSHAIKLEWEGFIDLEGKRIKDLVLSGRGREQLTWGNARFRAFDAEPDAAHLMAGRRIDLDSAVRYGITGAPIADEDATDASPPAALRGGPPQSLRKKMMRFRSGMRSMERDFRPLIGRLMEPFQGHLKAARYEEAEAVLDRALLLMHGDAGKDVSVTNDLRRARELLAQDKLDEATAMLDEILKRLER